MDNLIHAYAAPTTRAALAPFDYAPEALGPFDVEVRITHCGICHSDVHLVDNDWGYSTYPLVPGHEIVGEVVARGANAPHELGARVGIGWQRSACLACEQCGQGNENYCPQNKATTTPAFGGFADRIRVDGRFAFEIPRGLSSENAAPLLCAGVTVFSPLRHFEVRPIHRVGVIGIGGLGHLGLQFARAWGCEVTAFSTTADKEKEAREFGAHHFIATRDAQAMQKAAGRLDFILNTTHADLDWSAYLGLLRPGGKLCFLGAPPANVSVHATALFARKSITASLIGGRPMLRDMLEFAARHDVKARVEVVPMAEVNAAISKVKENKARYRMVLEAAAAAAS